MAQPVHGLETAAESCASALYILQPDRERVERWLKALASKKYAFGFGMLRDYDDHYDPFGVLLDLHDVMWELGDDGWGAEGSTDSIAPARLSELLGVHAADHQLLIELITLINDINDKASTFEDVHTVLTYGLNEMGARRGLGVKFADYARDRYSHDDRFSPGRYGSMGGRR